MLTGKEQVIAVASTSAAAASPIEVVSGAGGISISSGRSSTGQSPVPRETSRDRTMGLRKRFQWIENIYK